MERRWIPGNQFTLLENGEEFFPRVFAAIANARREVVVETFILFEDKVGLQMQEALIAANSAEEEHAAELAQGPEAAIGDDPLAAVAPEGHGTDADAGEYLQS